MPDIRQNLQINPNPLEIVVSTYLLFTALLIILFKSQLSEIHFHLAFRVSFIIVFYVLSLKKISGTTIIKYIRVFLPFFLLPYLYNETDYLNNLIIKSDLDIYISEFESNIFLSQPALVFSQLIPNNFFAESMYFGYFSYYLLIIGIPVYLYFKIDPYIGTKSIFILICSFLIYYSFFIIFPVAGPQFYFKNKLQPLPEGYIFGNIMRLIQSKGEAPTAAFPSSHISICVMLLWLCYKNAKRLLIIAIPISLLLILSTVYLRAHYIVDVIAGLLFAPLVYRLSDKLWLMLNNFEFSQLVLNKEYEYYN